MMINKVRKASLFCMMTIVACAMTSCLDNVRSDYTPRILMSPLYVNPYYVNDTLHAQDTLYVRYNEKAERSVSDTMLRGDTVMLGLAFDAGGNYLISSRVEWDTTAVKAWLGINDEIRSAMSDTTAISSGYLPYKPAYNVVSFPVYIVPQKAGSHTIKITVESDSKYSPASASFDLVVKEKQ